MGSEDPVRPRHGILRVMITRTELARRVKAGDVEAMAATGALLLHSRCTAANCRKAIGLMSPAAEQGDAIAAYNVAVAFWTLGTPADLKNAVSWLRKAVRRGSPDGRHLLGKAQLHGMGTPADVRRARRSFEQAANEGLREAALAAALANDFAEPRNPRRALYWYRRAARRGVTHAMVNLAAFYVQGDQVRRSPARARHWLERAAGLGDPFAKRELGRLPERLRAFAGASRRTR